MKPDYPPAMILGSHARLLPSTIVDDEYELSIWLPPSYESSEQAYPTLYVLDAPIFFGSMVWNAFIQNVDTDVPEMVVVGIGKRMKSLDEWWSIRARDYSPVAFPEIPGSGQAEAFLSFIEQELIPFVDTNYRTQRDDRILWGQSLGGSFAIYTMFSKRNLFNRYIMSGTSFSSADNSQTIFDYEHALDTVSLTSEVSLFISVGSLDQDYGPEGEAFMKTLSEKEIPNLKFRTMIFEGLGHTAAAVPGFIYGIEAVYALMSGRVS